MSAPMTAEEIRRYIEKRLPDFPWTEQKLDQWNENAVLAYLLEALDASEREHAELEEMKLQIGEMGQRVREGKR